MVQNEEKEGTYMGAYILAEDVYDFCGMKRNPDAGPDAAYYELETGVVKKLRGIAEQWQSEFCWPAFLFLSSWYVYRGMIMYAVILDIVMGIILKILPGNRILFWICWLILALISGYKAIPLYYRRIRKTLEKRGLVMRTPVKSEELSASLRKEGGPSVKCLLIYTFIRYLVVQCIIGIEFSKNVL